MTTKEMLLMFPELQKEVEELIKRRFKELIQLKINFHFRGSNRSCENKEIHSPHVHGHYHTTNYGELAYFCLGVEGKGLKIIVEAKGKGSLEVPAFARGYYVVIP